MIGPQGNGELKEGIALGGKRMQGILMKVKGIKWLLTEATRCRHVLMKVGKSAKKVKKIIHRRIHNKEELYRLYANKAPQ